MRAVLLASLFASGVAAAQPVPYQLSPPVPVGENVSVAPVPAGYADVLARVKGGETVVMAVGVPAPAGAVAVADAGEYGVAAGVWRCYPDGGRAVMVRESQPVATAATGPKYPWLNAVAPNLFPQQVPCVGPT